MLGDLKRARLTPRQTPCSLRSHVEWARCARTFIRLARCARPVARLRCLSRALADARLFPLTAPSVRRARAAVKPLRGRGVRLRLTPEKGWRFSVESKGFRMYGQERHYHPRCYRCRRTLAHCGDDHWVSVRLGSEGRLGWHRICCWCVIELESLGVGTTVIDDNLSSRCPVRVEHEQRPA